MSQNAPQRLYLMQVGSMPEYQIPIVCYLVQTGDGQNILIDRGRTHSHLNNRIRTAVSTVHPEGFEPPTFWFVARCSNPLSYGCKRLTDFYCQRGSGEKGIRTLERLLKTVNRLAGGPIRPLWHLPNRIYMGLCSRIALD